jgi:hypothetical protein
MLRAFRVWVYNRQSVHRSVHLPTFCDLAALTGMGGGCQAAGSVHMFMSVKWLSLALLCYLQPVYCQQCYSGNCSRDKGTSCICLCLIPAATLITAP